VLADVNQDTVLAREETFGSLALFGGVKQSGVGRKGMQFGIKTYQIIQYIQHMHFITMMDF